jgi:hypothetical protein
MIFLTNLLMNIVELGMPYLKLRLKLYQEDKKIKKAKDEGQAVRENLYQVEIESKLDPYESPLDDYMEMVISFGYVALFGSSLPLLPLLALVEIVLEIRVDAWKICTLTKRSHPYRSETIGVWRTIILAVAYAGAFTNSGIIFITLDMLTDKQMKILGFIALEHLMIVGMHLINVAVPDDPKMVTDGLVWSQRVAEEKEKKWKTDVREAEVSMSKGGEEFMITENDIKYNLD